jgi:glyoxylase-like metal-dependent hydrolase (beta-lactamase superfamily II)/predicted ester cyclase
MDQPEAVARRYFDAIAARDLDGLAAVWAPEGTDRLVGQVELHGPDGVRAYFAELFAAMPDFAMRVTQTTAEADRVAVQWRATATFAGPGRLTGIEPTGAKVDFQGIDVLVVRDGRIVANDALADGLSLARQIGLLPPAGSSTEARLNRAFNTRTKVARRVHVKDTEPVADGVWLIRGGFPLRTMNVYLIEEEGGGVCLFDAGISDMAHGLAAAGAAMGGITRVVLGHAHADHRGAAPEIDAPVFCHSAERASAEGDGGYPTFDFSKLRFPGPYVYPWYLKRWDGGPVRVAGTFEEGDEVAPGFKAVHLPGHAPGLVAIVRERDGLALTSDAFYTLDVETTLKIPPRIPHPAFTPEYEQARASLGKLAALDLRAAWPGHAQPLKGDVRAQLERAAAGG